MDLLLQSVMEKVFQSVTKTREPNVWGSYHIIKYGGYINTTNVVAASDVHTNETE